MTERDFLTIREVASRLGVSTGRIYQRIGAGEIPALREGRRFRIPRLAWERWLESQAERALATVTTAPAGR